MSGRGYLFSITEAELEGFLACGAGEARERWVTRLLASWDAGHVAEVDKAWAAIHRCLARPTADRPEDEAALRSALLGGLAVPASAHRVASVVGREAVPRVAEALARIDEPALRDRFFATLEGDSEAESDELDFLYTWQWFGHVRDLYAAAAREGRAVLFTVRDQPSPPRTLGTSPWSLDEVTCNCGRPLG